MCGHQEELDGVQHYIVREEGSLKVTHCPAIDPTF
jgi:hypothetical protein